MKILAVIVLLGILGGAALYYRDRLKETRDGKPSPSIAGWTGTSPTPTSTPTSTPTPSPTESPTPTPASGTTSIIDLTPLDTDSGANLTYTADSSLPQSGPGLNLVIISVLTGGGAISYRYLRIKKEYQRSLKNIQVM